MMKIIFNYLRRSMRLMSKVRSQTSESKEGASKQIGEEKHSQKDFQEHGHLHHHVTQECFINRNMSFSLQIAKFYVLQLGTATEI